MLGIQRRNRQNVSIHSDLTQSVEVEHWVEAHEEGWVFPISPI